MQHIPSNMGEEDVANEETSKKNLSYTGRIFEVSEATVDGNRRPERT